MLGVAAALGVLGVADAPEARGGVVARSMSDTRLLVLTVRGRVRSRCARTLSNIYAAVPREKKVKGDKDIVLA